jgi:arylsulfatase A
MHLASETRGYVMRRFRYPSFVMLVLIALASVMMPGYSAAAADKPNILVLFADDLGWADLACYGSKNTKTPNLDRLAAQGMRFTDFYAGAPNCSPSRACMLTGRTPSRTGMYSYIPPKGPLHLPASEITIAQLLRDAGYDTAHAGKWHLVHDMLSDKLPQPRDHGFNHSLGTSNNASPSHHNPSNFVRNGKAIGRVEGYSCQIVADEVIDWISTKRDKDKPFFACAWFHETHTPIASPADLVARHPNAKSKKDALYYANVENMDAACGRILKTLDELKLTENTFVIFTSDNGGVRAESNGPLRGRKSFVWEGGIREPGIMRWPGRIKPGSVSNEPAGVVDLLPTFCAMGGAKVPADRPIDGVSLFPLFEGKSIARKTPMFWFFYRTAPAAAMRDGDWVMVGYLAGKVPASHALSAEQMAWLKKTKLDKFELYNVRKDIAQKNELSASEPDRFARMKKQISELHGQVVAEGPVWQFPPSGAKPKKNRKNKKK